MSYSLPNFGVNRILASVIVDRTPAACRSRMQAVSAAISRLGFNAHMPEEHRDLTHKCRRSTARSGGASMSLAGGGSWAAGAGARWSQDRCSAKESEGDRSERKKMKGMGSAPPRLTLFIGWPPNLSVAAPCSVQHAPTALSVEADFSLNRLSATT
jgi:hypothetical protein